jgi:asparagine synthase (glutamine-hydrolysing)
MFGARDVDVVLTGNFGDFLFAGGIDWACDALRYGRWRLLATEVAHAARQDGVLAQRRNPSLRRIASRALGRTSRAPDRLRLLRPPYRDAVAERLRAERAAYRRFSRPQQAELILGSHAAFDAAGEDWFAQRHGIEFRSPFRDLALNRWCLSVPADLGVRRGVEKWLLREAMRGVLPEELRTRPKGSDLTPWQVDAAERQRSTWAPLRQAGAAVASTYLDPDAAAPRDADEAAVLDWVRIAYGSWLTVRAS